VTNLYLEKKKKPFGQERLGRRECCSKEASKYGGVRGEDPEAANQTRSMKNTKMLSAKCEKGPTGSWALNRRKVCGHKRQ